MQEIANTPNELLADVITFVQNIKTTPEPGSDHYTVLLNRIDYLEAIVGIRKGLDEFDSGEGIPAEIALANLQQKFNIPPPIMKYRVEVQPAALQEIEDAYCWICDNLGTDSANRW